MNIMRAFISQLYGFAGIAAIDSSKLLNTIRSISFNLPSYLLCRLLGAGRLKEEIRVLYFYFWRDPSTKPVLYPLYTAFFGEP